MPWQFYLGLALGVLASAPLAFIIGKAVGVTLEPVRAAEKEDAVDATADKERAQIERELQQRIEETLTSDAKELTDALNSDFDKLAPPVRVREPGK